jgi:predicted RNA-binding protein YlxR (DUF448 family)
MRKESHSPERTCIGCNTADQKREMVRLSASGDGIAIDWDDRLPGRGAYLHARADCLERFVVSKVREFRSLRRKIEREERVRIADEVRRRLATNTHSA